MARLRTVGKKRTSGQCVYKCNVPTTWQVSASGKCWLNISITETWLKVMSSGRLFHVDFRTKMLCAIMIYIIRATRSILFSFWFDQRNNSRRRGPIMKMFIIFFFYLALATSSCGLRPLACWDLGFESHGGHGYLSVVSVVCCQVEVSATSWSLVQRSPTDCATSLCVT